MASKRPRDSDAEATTGPAAKKHRKGFRVGPENLPDGSWKRKVDKIKKDLIHKAKVKKAYKKVKAREEAQADVEAASKSKHKSAEEENHAGDDNKHGVEEEHNENDDDDDANQPPSPQIHPERQAMLEDDEKEDTDTKATPPGTRTPGDDDRPPRRRKQKQRKPGYFDKAIEEGGRKKAEAEARAQEIERRKTEREQKLAQRQRFQRALTKARTPGRDGKRKLGRESGLMLEKVKRMVGEGK
ncbi:hypothetical protein UCREL1_5829 [Eutypa lata UCREL1]|uniref:rRNA-processing protein FYV7 n=1 Tax=Eutypa lata (strain UCR-EL1) TaxID=1287681 RepID=M7TKE5_EUTLA|nr:hypothetical protein UCREL1_5829 [Eutypa lata UCREL1]